MIYKGQSMSVIAWECRACGTLDTYPYIDWRVGSYGDQLTVIQIECLECDATCIMTLDAWGMPLAWDTLEGGPLEDRASTHTGMCRWVDPSWDEIPF